MIKLLVEKEVPYCNLN